MRILSLVPALFCSATLATNINHSGLPVDLSDDISAREMSVRSENFSDFQLQLPSDKKELRQKKKCAIKSSAHNVLSNGYCSEPASKTSNLICNAYENIKNANAKELFRDTASKFLHNSAEANAAFKSSISSGIHNNFFVFVSGLFKFIPSFKLKRLDYAETYSEKDVEFVFNFDGCAVFARQTASDFFEVIKIHKDVNQSVKYQKKTCLCNYSDAAYFAATEFSDFETQLRCYISKQRMLPNISITSKSKKPNSKLSTPSTKASNEFSFDNFLQLLYDAAISVVKENPQNDNIIQEAIDTDKNSFSSDRTHFSFPVVPNQDSFAYNNFANDTSPMNYNYFQEISAEKSTTESRSTPCKKIVKNAFICYPPNLRDKFTDNKHSSQSHSGKLQSDDSFRLKKKFHFDDTGIYSNGTADQKGDNKNITSTSTCFPSESDIQLHGKRKHSSDKKTKQLLSVSASKMEEELTENDDEACNHEATNMAGKHKKNFKKKLASFHKCEQCTTGKNLQNSTQNHHCRTTRSSIKHVDKDADIAIPEGFDLCAGCKILVKNTDYALHLSVCLFIK